MSQEESSIIWEVYGSTHEQITRVVRLSEDRPHIHICALEQAACILGVEAENLRNRLHDMLSERYYDPCAESYQETVLAGEDVLNAHRDYLDAIVDEVINIGKELQAKAQHLKKTP
ncbi:hypothetical protein EI42_06314 [Thermosporothrix hazakensis]|jgi:hypothetical protein|uniref:Uncharacterized protein n=1 Tax=Thermosporothrix hazakensis TaxID=644383 RepID=A0A326TQ49_THEHA|nr:hypothetical protein [Thermosporothrix hazakensis]PZW18146.1 hypothetical protein EI42_06314 [Thermosporothrix hazakensis]